MGRKPNQHSYSTAVHSQQYTLFSSTASGTGTVVLPTIGPTVSPFCSMILPGDTSRTKLTGIKFCLCQSELLIKVWKRIHLTHIYRYPHKESKIMKNQVNMIPPKENKKYPINDFKERRSINYQWTENTSLKDKNTQTKEKQTNNKKKKKQCMQNHFNETNKNPKVEEHNDWRLNRYVIQSWNWVSRRNIK